MSIILQKNGINLLLEDNVNVVEKLKDNSSISTSVFVFKVVE